MKYFLLFIIYSFIGWSIEVIRCLTIDKKLINRGFLIGPYCPIYGFGCLSISILLNKYLEDPIALFIMSMVICGILEYITSFIMEKLFNARWWDYKENKYNINGRICLETLILFGLGSIALMYFLNPIIMSVINKIPILIQNIIGTILLIIFIVDLITSFYIINNIKEISLTAKGDSTEKISNYVKTKLREKSILYRRIEEAFPKLTLDKEKLEKYIKKRKKELEDKLQKEKKKNEKRLQKIKEKSNKYKKKNQK